MKLLDEAMLANIGKDFFSNQWGVPQCISAIDRSHILITAPEEHSRVFSIKDCFSGTRVGNPWSMHDARVLQQSHCRMSGMTIITPAKQKETTASWS